MKGKRNIQLWWVMVSLVMVLIAAAAPVISPFAPLREKECKDNVDITKCEFVKFVRTFCCLSQMLFDCGQVEEWKHTTDGTYHYRNPDKCDNLEIACSPYNNHCD
ncbi:MAG: hypothetical protein C4295_05345 [Candidatus Fervidibacterota bacterium]